MKFFFILSLCFLASCASRKEKEDTLVCLQMVSQNGLSEMINDPEKLEELKRVDFFNSQPYKQIVRTYAKNQEGKTPSFLTTYHENGSLWQYLEIVDGRAVGTYKEWFPSGEIKVEASVCSGEANLSPFGQKGWSFDGVCKVWSEDKVLLASISYEKGSLEGKSIYYHPQGSLKREAFYKRGELEGDFSEYREDGTLISQGFYQKGLLQGTSISYFHSKEPSSLEHYHKGNIQKAVYYDKTGAIISQIEEGSGFKIKYEKDLPHQKIQYEKGVPKGKITIFNKVGEEIGYYFIENGEKQGEELYFYTKEETEEKKEKFPKFSFQWEKGVLQGISKTWYPNGQIASQKKLFRNKKEGAYCVWYYTGELMYLEEYENDLLSSGKYYKKGENTPFCEVIKGEGEAAFFEEKTGFLLKKVQYSSGKPL